MKSLKKIVFITGSRADYGIVRNYLKLLDNDEEIDLSIIATGALLEDEYGKQIKLILDDKFKIFSEIKIDLDSSSNERVLHTMSIALDKFGKLFENNEFDMSIILGDRYEMLSVATALAINNIPILHIHGGEATFGNYDEFIRHAITKMSLYHFASTEEYKNRIIQLGESPKNVFNLGALGAENCTKINLNNISNEVKMFEGEKFFVILFHPETISKADPLEQVKCLLQSLDNYKDYKKIFIGSNSDTKSNLIRKEVKNYVFNSNNSFYFENLKSNDYHYLVKNSLCLIGNSSSGIIEAPTLQTFTVNIGDRQAGRVRGNSIIDTNCNSKDIIDAINKVIYVNANKTKIYNPYYIENCADNYYNKTKEILSRLDNDTISPKIFYDLKN